MKIKALLLLSSTLTLLLVGCTNHQSYRNDYTLCSASNPAETCQASAVQEHKDPEHPDADYLLNFIEFDDQGQLFDREQMDSVLDAIWKRAASNDLLMVVFVHGWKHSAAPGDPNIETFRDSLEWLSRLETRISETPGYAHKARKVVGIYLGWRGGSITWPVLKEATFWERKNTAHKVGQGGVTEVLNRLELVRTTKGAVHANDQSKEQPSGLANNNPTRLVLVGHSFGGAVVFSALNQILMERFVDTKGPKALSSDVVGFGNLVVLINPAFEALRFAPLSDMANARRSYFEAQLPVMAVLTSEADDATGIAFPAGRAFSTLFENHRDVQRKDPVSRQNETISQKKANVTAVGHFEPYQTHTLTPTVDKAAFQCGTSRESLKTFVEVSEQWAKDHAGSEIQFEGTTLQRDDHSVGRNPYLMVKVDGELIADHNDISDERIACFLRQLILISGQSHDLDARREVWRMLQAGDRL